MLCCCFFVVLEMGLICCEGYLEVDTNKLDFLLLLLLLKVLGRVVLL